MSHRTFRSLDEAPKLVGFTARQWALLIADSCAVLGVVYLTHLPAKPAITLCVFLIGLPTALSYVSESGGLQLGGLLVDMCRWRFGPKSLAAVPGGFSGRRGLVVLGGAPDEARASELGEARMAEDGVTVAIRDLLDGERWQR